MSARGEGSLIKDFVIPSGEWTPDHADTLEEFLNEIVLRHIVVKTGSYLGTGRLLTVEVKELPGPPKLMVVQTSAGGTAFLTLVAGPGQNIAAWNQKGFTLSLAAAVNTASVDYRFLILA